ncbi:energy transducer TonB [Luteimonas kalidii]|uniref:Energy transducer TonB n=1 Tax=Luteimonas kalidii TaxID=3042025 RepID=A0ABT6JX84_9GAMM|nr:energy transducer TonB [Luteimonas kalidii]MDH5835184.1 energy transducer TonB [Luteimonas kalidii]
MKIRRHSRWCVLLLWLAAGAAQAAGVAEARKQVEASMLVTGRVTITREGTVSDWTIDQREKLPEVVANMVDAAAPGWRFEPIEIDGEPAHGSARMSLQMIAERIDDERFRVSIRNGYFGREAVSRAQPPGRRGKREDASFPDDRLSGLEMRAPGYPALALEAGVQGTVYVIVRVDRSGRVQDAAVEQVNLRALGNAREMARMRDLLAKPALAAARRWTFRTPVRGEWVDEEWWSARVPVDYLIGGMQPGYGQWQAYVPGPRSPVPWQMESLEGFDVAPDTLVAGEVHQVGTGLKLLSPLQGG